MQTPICENCLKSETLCDLCREKLDKNIITQKDIDVSKTLHELSAKVKSLEDVKLIKIIDASNIIIICNAHDGPKLVGKGGSVVKALAKKFKKNIKIVERDEKFENFVRTFISPVQLNGINTVYSMSGQYYKIRIPSKDETNLGLTSDALSNLFENIYNIKTKIVFENL